MTEYCHVSSVQSQAVVVVVASRCSALLFALLSTQRLYFLGTVKNDRDTWDSLDAGYVTVLTQVMNSNGNILFVKELPAEVPALEPSLGSW